MKTVRHETVHYTAKEMTAKETAGAAIKAKKRRIMLVASGAIMLVALFGCIACLGIGSLAPSVEPTPTSEPTGIYVPQVITTEANADNATAAAAPVVVTTATLAPTRTSQPTSMPTVALAPTATSTPMLLPTLISPAQAPPPTARPYTCDCSYNRYNCPDFGTQREAQSCYDYCRSVGAGDVHRLDADNDNRACESLP